jgi:copper(I)-binding protein
MPEPMHVRENQPMEVKRAARIVGATLALAALAAGAEGEGMKLERAWARATPPGSPVAAAYLVIDNRGARSDRLLSASSPRADKVEVHATVHDGDVARMRKVEPLHVGAGERVVLEPGGMHLMLMGLRKPLAEGERIPLVLEFEVAGEQRTEIRVFAAGSDEAGGNHHAHH